MTICFINYRHNMLASSEMSLVEFLHFDFFFLKLTSLREATVHFCVLCIYGLMSFLVDRRNQKLEL